MITSRKRMSSLVLAATVCIYINFAAAQSTEMDSEAEVGVGIKSAGPLMDQRHLIEPAVDEEPPVVRPMEPEAKVASEVLANMDYLRGFRDTDFSFKAEVITLEGEEVLGKHVLEVKVDKNGHAVVEILSPLNEKGRRTLKRGNDMWLFLPNVRNVMRIAPLQRVFGDASIADVLSTSYVNDYVFDYLDHIEGELSTTKLMVKSTDKKSNYGKILVHFDLDKDVPLSSEHFSLSGRSLKKINYVSFSRHYDEMKLETLNIMDSMRKDQVVWLKFFDYEKGDFPASLFTKSGFHRI